MRVTQVAVLIVAVFLPVVVPVPASSYDSTITFGFTAYSPAGVGIEAGETVTWSGDFASHPMLNVDPSYSVPISGIGAAAGTSFSHTFTTPGVYYFRCNVHGLPPSGTMRNLVVVYPAEPSTTITSPAVNAVISSTLVTISGTAFDGNSVTSVGVAIYRSTSGGQYWNGSAWQAQNITVPATLTPSSGSNVNWTYQFAPPNVAGNYATAAVAVDASGKYGIAPYRAFRVVESIPPTVSVISPTTNQVVATNPVTISGTASDNAGIYEVRLAIYRPVGPLNFWNGSAWGAGYETVPAVLSAPTALTSPWTYSFAPPQSGGLYYVSATVIDTSYNYSYTSFTPFWRADTVAPSGSVTSPVNNGTISLPFSGGIAYIAGGANDNSGVQDVRIAVYRASDGKYYNGSSVWQSGFSTVSGYVSSPGAPATTWTVDDPVPITIGEYYVAGLIYDTNYNYFLTPFNKFTAVA